MLRSVFLPAAAAMALLSPAGAQAAPQGAGAAPPPVVQAAGQVRIEAPGTVDPNETVVVAIFDERLDGQIEIWGPVTQQGKGARLKQVAVEGSTIAIDAPAEPGSYELRYIGMNGALHARRTLDVAAVPVTLSVPEQMSAGMQARVRWRGPARPGDMLQIADPRTGAVVSETPAEGVAGAENVSTIAAPQQTGAYELRYRSGWRQATLRSLPVSVTRGNAWLRAPVEVTAGERFTARWNGPVGPDLAFQIFNPETDSVVTSQSDTAEATLTAPPRRGKYRIRYVNTATGQIHSDLPLVVAPK